MATDARTDTPIADEEVVHSARQAERLVAKLTELAPEIEAEAEGNEQAGKLSDRTVDLIREAELPRMLMPVEMGGLGMFLRDALKVVDKLGQIDASAGWIGGNWSAAGMFLSYFDDGTVKELLGSGQIPYFGASSTPTGQAVPVAGGYRFSGTYQYGSGDLHASWVFCPGFEIGPDGKPVPGPGGMPAMKSYVVDAADIEFRGNWDTLGLRGTGSVDFAVTDAFVPANRVLDLLAGPPARGRRQLSGGILSILPFLHTGFALGASRRVLDELTAYAKRPSSRGTTLAESQVFRLEFARHEVAVRSARAFVYESWSQLHERLVAGEPMTRRDYTLLRAALIHMHDVLRAAATFAFTQASGVSLRAGVLQRWIRDSLSGCQHLIVAESGYTDVAWELIGAPDNLVWGPFSLVPLPEMP
jgi:alkylation response protein AidB-like acyl-CoA dehydrogenase